MIYYIYKVRRKQTSIRSSRSALPHRYLRYISWISWVRRPRCQPSTSWVSTCAPLRAATRARHFHGGTYILQPRSCLCHRLGDRANILKKKKTTSLLSPRISHVSPLPRCSARKLFAHAACDLSRPVRRPHLTSLPRPSYKQKMRARSIAPRTRSPRLSNVLKKSVDFPLKKAHVGTPGLHALAAAARTYSLTARIHYYPFSFLLFYKGKEKRKQK